MHLFGGISSAHHCISKKLRRRKELVRTRLQAFLIPLENFSPTNDCSRNIPRHALVSNDGFLVGEAFLAPLAIARARIAGANQFGIVQGPHHADSAAMRNLRNYRRKLRVDIIQVDDIRFEIIEQSSPLAAHLAIAEGARERSHLGHVPWPVLAPGTLQVLGIVHRKDGHLVAVLLKQLLQVEHIDAVATATIIELVGKKNFHIKMMKRWKSEFITVQCFSLCFLHHVL